MNNALNAEPPNRADAIFGSALDLPPAERDAHIVESCGEDGALLAEVRTLIEAHEEAPDGFLDLPVVTGVAAGDLDATLDLSGTGRPPGKAAGPARSGSINGDAPQPAAPLTEKEGDLIGPYKLLQQIGEGGFGTVWMAEQSVPITRKVALKVIKAGMDTREVLARFEAERQALAMMDDPNIAKVLDAGATETGRPWFAMELVKGIPITEFCDEQGLGTRERLALFSDVCSAVNHAHQKGIIHRDLKPSNVMVTLHGDKPVAKVIDFGIAKATQGRLTDQTLFTRYEQFMGTPVYMSPEQASLSGLDIDTRSDIYALGVLLYELLIGRPPFEAKTLVSAGYDEMRRIIREDEPLKPSARLATVAGKERTVIAKARHVSPEKLNCLVESDLDWIVMKAIEKDRARRYETANAFAQDIGNYLADEAVNASPPSAGYKFKKFARRNKAALRVAAGIAVLLIAATAVSSWQAVRATRAEMKTAETLAEVAAERDAKEQALEEAEAVTTFLTEAFESPDPARDGRTITVAETLETAAKKLETDLANQPGRQAKLRGTLGTTLRQLGLYEESIALHKKALDHYQSQLGPEHPDTLSAMLDLADAYGSADRYNQALAFTLKEEALEMSRKSLGNEHAITLRALLATASSYRWAGRYRESLELNNELLETRRRVNGPEHAETIRAMQGLAELYSGLGRWEDASAIMDEVLHWRLENLGPTHPDTLSARSNVASCYREAGREDEALSMREELLELKRGIFGPDHSTVFFAMLNLALSLEDVGRVEESIELREECLVMSRKTLGRHHHNTINAMENLARSYVRVGRGEEALKLGNESVALTRDALGPEHPSTLYAMKSLAIFLGFLDRNEEALELTEEVLELQREVLGKEHPNTIQQLENLGVAYDNVGRYDEALGIRENVLQLRRKARGLEHPKTLNAMRNLSVSLTRAGRRSEALAMREEALELSRKLYGEDHPETQRSKSYLVESLRYAGRHEESIRMGEEMLEAMFKMYGEEHRDILNALQQLALSYISGDREEMAFATYERAVKLSRKLYGIAHLRMLDVTESIAHKFSARGWHEEAIEMSREVLEIRREHFGDEDPDAIDSLWNYSKILEHAGRLDEAIALMEEHVALKCRTGQVSEGGYRGNLGAGMLEELYRKSGQPEKVAQLFATILGEVLGAPPGEELLARLTESGMSRRHFQLMGEGRWRVDLGDSKEFTDLSPLAGMNLAELKLWKTGVTDLSPLRDMPLEELELGSTKVADLGPLVGMPLRHLHLGWSKSVTDIEALRGMPLEFLSLAGCTGIKDFSPLEEARELEVLFLPGNAKGIDFLRDFPRLKHIGFQADPEKGYLPNKTAEEFWEWYDSKKGSKQRKAVADE